MADSITVSALNKYVRSLLEGDPFLGDIAVRGEVSNFNMHYKTGHCYFSLKDEKASVRAVMFRPDAQKLAFQPENGMAVVAFCRVSLYERDGSFQVYVQEMLPDGVGAAQLAFEQLKKRLEAEGLFLPEHKKALPRFPECVGLVTSRSGAALQDILKVAARRCPAARFLLAPVTVQGNAAAGEIAKAIQLLDAQPNVEVIIVARGGGSAEDLWVFNAEKIARAAFESKTPVVSAIGHEIDFTILDFVADLRAPTPSAAAEEVLPNLQDMMLQMMNIYRNIAFNMHNVMDSWYNILARHKRQAVLAGVGQTVFSHRERLQKMRADIRGQQQRSLSFARQRLGAAVSLAGGLNPYSILARGYGVVEKEGAAINSVNNTEKGQHINVRMHDGELGCLVENIRHSRQGENHGK